MEKRKSKKSRIVIIILAVIISWLFIGNLFTKMIYKARCGAKIPTIKRILLEEYGEEITYDLEVYTHIPGELRVTPVENMFMGFIVTRRVDGAFWWYFLTLKYIFKPIDYCEYYIKSANIISTNSAFVRIYGDFKKQEIESSVNEVKNNDKYIYTNYYSEVLNKCNLDFYNEYDKYFKDEHNLNLSEDVSFRFNYDVPEIEINHIDLKNNPHTKYYFDKVGNISLNSINKWEGAKIDKIAAAKITSGIINNELQILKKTINDERFAISDFDINVYSDYKSENEYNKVKYLQKYPQYTAKVKHDNEDIKMMYREDTSNYKQLRVDWTYDELVEAYGINSNYVNNDLIYTMTKQVRDIKIANEYDKDTIVNDMDSVTFAGVDYLVLDRKERAALLLCKYLQPIPYLVYKRFDGSVYNWNESNAKEDLEHNVFDIQFNKYEQVTIIPTMIDGVKSKLFILSFDELNNYFKTDRNEDNHRNWITFSEVTAEDTYYIRPQNNDDRLRIVNNRGRVVDYERKLGGNLRYAFWVRIFDENEFSTYENELQKVEETAVILDKGREETVKEEIKAKSELTNESIVAEEIVYEKFNYSEPWLETHLLQDYTWWPKTKDIGNTFNINDYNSNKYDDYFSYKEKYKIGNVIEFGEWYQDEFKKRSIEWVIVDNDGSNLLLMSKYALYASAFSKYGKSTYGDSDLRKEVNKFYYRIFDSDKKAQKRILDTEIKVEDEYGKVHILKDKMFVLSDEELKRYFENAINENDGKQLATATTRYVKANCQTKAKPNLPYDESDTWHYGNTKYFTRSANTEGKIKYVDFDGTINEEGVNPDDELPFRVSMWVTLPEAIDINKVITIGKYEQDGIEENGKEALEFVVLDAYDDKVWLGTKYAIDLRRFNEDKLNIDWSLCELRNWLNNEFYNIAFDAIDKQKILKMNNKSMHYKDWNGKDAKEVMTEDCVFVLSNEEAARCFYNRDSAIISIKPTQYVINKIPEKRKVRLLYKYDGNEAAEYV